MYNENQKLSFIESYTSDSKLRAHCKLIFERLEPIEQLFEKDIACFDSIDMEQAIAAIAGFSGRTTRKAVYTLKHYIKWCIDNHIPDTNADLLQFSAAQAQANYEEGIEKSLISSPLHLHTILEAVFRPINDNTIHNLYRLFFWLAYSGLTEDEMNMITAQNIDWNYMSININNESFPIYREEVPAIMSCINLVYFEKHHPLHSKIIYLQRVPGNSILRGSEGSKTNINKCELSKVVRGAVKEGKIDISLSYRNVWTSGLFYNAYECERAGIPYDFSRAVKQYFVSKGLNPDDIDTKRRLEINRKFKLDYNRWKAALNK